MNPWPCRRAGHHQLADARLLDGGLGGPPWRVGSKNRKCVSDSNKPKRASVEMPLAVFGEAGRAISHSAIFSRISSFPELTAHHLAAHELAGCGKFTECAAMAPHQPPSDAAVEPVGIHSERIGLILAINPESQQHSAQHDAANNAAVLALHDGI